MAVFSHPLPALYQSDAKVLILGSFPSVKSREAMFFYGHPQNRFWPMLAKILDRPMPSSIAEKRALVLENRLAMWDVVKTCEIKGSSDSSLKAIELTDISSILESADIEAILLNGKKAYNLFVKASPSFSGDIHSMPSTSPANAATSMEQLVKAWSIILDYIKPKEGTK